MKMSHLWYTSLSIELIAVGRDGRAPQTGSVKGCVTILKMQSVAEKYQMAPASTGANKKDFTGHFHFYLTGSHKDRHARLRSGRIGLTALKYIVQHPALQNKPFILETPNDMEGYKEEIALVKEWMYDE